MKRIPLRRLTTMSYGDALAAEVRRDGPVPVFSSGGRTGLHDTCNTLSPAIVVGRKGSHGTVWWTDEPAFVIDTAYSIDSSNTKADLRWLYYVLGTLRLKDLSADVGIPGLSREKAYEAAVPADISLAEQRRIADFLDDRVSRIDNIIAARRNQISSARSLPWAAFDQQAVESGAGTVLLRRAIAFISDGPFGSAFSSDDYIDAGPIAVRLGNIGFAEFRSDDLVRVPTSIYESHPRTHVRPGDLLVASLGDSSNHAGRACVAPNDIGPAMVKGKCYVARANPQAASGPYLARMLSSPSGAAQLARSGRGATRNMLNLDLLLSTAFLLPSFEKQKEIVGLAIELENESRQAVRALTASIYRLTEYKHSLITAAVTGELDVTTASTVVPA